MTTSLRKTTFALSLVAMLGPLAAAAAPQEPGPAQPASVERVQDSLNKTPSQSFKFDAKVPVPVATFKVTVNQRLFVEPIMDSLRKEFELTPLQRQSAEWSARCCGLSIAALTDGLERAFRRWEERRIHDRVSRELAEVIAAADK